MEGVSTAAIEILVQNLINVFKEESSLLRGLDGEAKQLQKTLGMIQAYLSDAENKSITQESVKIWLKELEGVAFDADNALDELNYHLLHKQINKMKTKAKDKVLSCFSSCIHLSRRRDMAHTIRQINATFESKHKRAADLGLQSAVVNAPAAAPSASAETDSFTSDPIFIGRDDDVPILVDMLTQTQTHPQERIFSTVALVGMGGVGKTTLTKKVFHHERVKTRFGSLIWVHVSQTFDPIILFNKILSTLTSSHTGVETNRQVILKELQEALKDKTYLLILDDVWNEDVQEWEGFINSMEGVTSTKENGIMVTTRNQKVASIVKPLEIHALKGLSDEECWSIIKAKAFDGNGEVQPAVETIGRKIAERCQGLPLAANVVGGVLRCQSEEEWRSINEDMLSYGEGAENIKKILKLSFDNLSSPSLKKCFAYCSVFPKGHKIVKQELIELWMAEGFLQPSGRDDMESMGNTFFNVLMQNSLLQQVAYTYYYGDALSYVMHDLVHDMASSVFGGSHNARDGIVRHMFLKGETSAIPKEVAKHVRTLFLEGGTSSTTFSDFKRLRNLTLIGHSYQELPNSIRELIHLRNLNISRTRIGHLPQWIGKLHYLETLNAYHGLRELPSTLKYLINLRHLYIDSRVELPAEIGRLTCLQTLERFEVGKEKGYQIEELGNLKNLKGKLEIGNLERVGDKEEAMKAKMMEKSNLSILVFKWDWGGKIRNYESVLEGLLPHPNLEKLEIYGFRGKRFPRWIEKMAVRDGPQGSWVPLDKLVCIVLRDCSECEEIPTIEHLPNLKSLTLRRLKKVRFINNILFSHLMSLEIIGLPDLECLPDGLFNKNPNLRKLYIGECRVLRELPDGLDTLSSLEELSIWHCRDLFSIGKPNGGGGQPQGIVRSLKVTIRYCEGLLDLPCQMLESWVPSLEYLDLWELRSLMNLPMVIDCLSESARLTYLRIRGVPKFMTSGSVESWGLGSLKRLEIDVSVKWSRETSDAIEETVDAIFQGCYNSLTYLYLNGVENWEWVPQSIQHLTALSELELENIGVEELPQWLGNLSSLTRLDLFHCKKLRRLPSLDALKSLNKLSKICCPKLRIDSKWRNHPNIRVYDS